MTTMRPPISYLRVSTDKQGKSGLGIEAQQSASLRQSQRAKSSASSSNSSREKGPTRSIASLSSPPPPAKVKRLGCSVGVAKLDRLSRDVAFISGLMAQRVAFIVAELGAPMPIRSCSTCSRRSPRRNGP